MVEIIAFLVLGQNWTFFKGLFECVLYIVMKYPESIKIFFPSTGYYYEKKGWVSINKRITSIRVGDPGFKGSSVPGF